MRNKKTKLAAFLIIIFLGLMSFGIWQYVNKNAYKQVKQDILMAQECGMDGLKCCASEPKCSFGQQCCVNPSNESENQCADTCGCGKQDQFCCANSQCEQGMACIDAKCEACGGENQPCCASNCSGRDKLGNLLTCFGNKCVGCGLLGRPCCEADKCLEVKGIEKSFSECAGGLCQACGGNQQAACLAGKKCLDSYLLNNKNCFQCGNENQPCCENSKCNEKSKLKCLQGFCQ
jgi:hypothetical protein